MTIAIPTWRLRIKKSGLEFSRTDAVSRQEIEQLLDEELKSTHLETLRKNTKNTKNTVIFTSRRRN